MPELIITARQASLNEYVTVKRILPFRQKRMVGPFIFMDHGGPVTKVPTPASNMDVIPHPHIGLSTVSYLLGGQVTHRDSLGVEQIIRPGEVNWMTAGKGIAHSERFEDPASLASGKLELLQTWVALPEKDEESDPTFNNYKPEKLPIFNENGIRLRLIAGNAYGLRNDVKTHSPLFYMHGEMEKGASFNLPTEHPERAIYIAHGNLEVNGQAYTAGQMIVFSKHEDTTFTATENSTIMLLGGEPLGERYIWWNFVSSRRERIDQAKEDWKQGRIVLPPNDDKEFMPLPEEKMKLSENAPRPEPLS